MKRIVMKSVLFPALFLVVSFLSSCGKDNGPVISEDRDTGFFSGVRLVGSSTVIVQYDSITSVRVETNEGVMDALETKVSSDILVVQFKKSIRGNHRTHVYLRTPHMNNIILDGSGSIHVRDSFTANKMNVLLKGSGTVTVPSQTSRIQAALDGSGNINLSGVTTVLNADLQGSGNIRAFELQSDTAYAYLEGSGNIELFVNRHLDARLDGSGNIRYKGKPATVNSQVDGSGNISKSN